MMWLCEPCSTVTVTGVRLSVFHYHHDEDNRPRWRQHVKMKLEMMAMTHIVVVKYFFFLVFIEHVTKEFLSYLGFFGVSTPQYPPYTSCRLPTSDFRLPTPHHHHHWCPPPPTSTQRTHQQVSFSTTTTSTRQHAFSSTTTTSTTHWRVKAWFWHQPHVVLRAYDEEHKAISNFIFLFYFLLLTTFYRL